MIPLGTGRCGRPKLVLGLRERTKTQMGRWSLANRCRVHTNVRRLPAEFGVDNRQPTHRLPATAQGRNNRKQRICLVCFSVCFRSLCPAAVRSGLSSTKRKCF